MKERFAKLIDVKSIISIVLTIVFCYLAVVGRINADLYMAIYTTVIAFFFGVQYSKAQAEKK